MSELAPNEPAHPDKARLQRAETLLASRLNLSVSQLVNSMGPDAASFVQRAIEWEFADVAAHSSLDMRTQEVVAITTLATLGQTAAPVLAMRIQSALRAGLSRQEIIDVFAQMALGTGLPVALAATKVATEVFSRTPD
jgi:4-carboxymuconolactone decarboxylase